MLYKLQLPEGCFYFSIVYRFYPLKKLKYLAAPKRFFFMDYSNIVSVSGLSGLQELISTKTDGAVVRSLEDKSSRFISNRIHRFSHLESIEIFTSGDNVNLVEIFYAMEKSNEPFPDEKNEEAVKKYFEKVYPDMDFERVYKSDLKKMVKWFDELKKYNIEIKLSEPEEEPVPEPEPEEQPVEEKKTNSLKKTASKKTTPKSKTESKKEETKKPAKKKK